MDKKRIEIFALFFYCIAVLIFYTAPLNLDNHGNIANIISSTFQLPPIYFGYLALKYFGAKTTQGKSIFFILISLISWAIADIIWSVIPGSPVVSIADVFYLAGYPFFAFGVLAGIQTLYPDFLKSIKNLAAISLITLSVVAIYLKFFPFLWSSESGFIENLTTAGYVLADLVLIVLILMIIYLVFSGFYSNSWIIIGAAIVANFIGDLMYTLNSESYAPGSLIDLWWLFGGILLSVGFIVLVKTAETLSKRISLPIPKGQFGNSRRKNTNKNGAYK
ncbi:MAG TPA: hypothetical protein VI564_00295 [Candidatus Nanoarchaeia archaeon]|nr:hypothetical protein [Candidatus Nanoarchaeia archaeon]